MRFRSEAIISSPFPAMPVYGLAHPLIFRAHYRQLADKVKGGREQKYRLLSIRYD